MNEDKKCPDCGRQMSKGRLRIGEGKWAWQPEGSKPILGKISRAMGFPPKEAYRCSPCGIILFYYLDRPRWERKMEE